MLTGPVGVNSPRRSIRAPAVSSFARSGAGLFSHSSSFDQRWRPEALRTAMATAFF